MARPAPGPEINLGDDLELVELLERRETLYREIRAGQRELEQIRAVLAARLGEATYGRVANWEIFWSESNYRPQPARIMRALGRGASATLHRGRGNQWCGAGGEIGL
jgi:hypothetical protein